MTDSRNGLQAPADPGRSSNPQTQAAIAECLLRALREDHQRVSSHHANLCLLCLLVAARFGELIPAGPYVEPNYRATVYARALFLVGKLKASDVETVLEAYEQGEGSKVGTEGYWFAARRLMVWLDILSGRTSDTPPEEFDARAYQVICDAVRASVVSASESMPGPDGYSGAVGAPSAAGLDAVACDSLAADLTEASGLRCPACNNLRRAIPKHQPSCLYSRENCPGCVYAGEPHLVSCPVGCVDLDTAGVGIDMPGVGVVFDHPNRKETAPDGDTGGAGDGIRSHSSTVQYPDRIAFWEDRPVGGAR